MLPTISVIMPDCLLREMLWAPDSDAYDKAFAEGVIKPGMDIVYGQHVAYILDGGGMIIEAENWEHPLTLQSPPIPNMGGVPEFSFTVNGVPFTGGGMETH